MIDREELARLQHEIWSHWMRYQFSVMEGNKIPQDKVERRTRQMNTSYDQLTEKEKDSDREQADKILSLIK